MLIMFAASLTNGFAAWRAVKQGDALSAAIWGCNAGLSFGFASAYLFSKMRANQRGAPASGREEK